MNSNDAEVTRQLDQFVAAPHLAALLFVRPLAAGFDASDTSAGVQSAAAMELGSGTPRWVPSGGCSKIRKY